MSGANTAEPIMPLQTATVFPGSWLLGALPSIRRDYLGTIGAIARRGDIVRFRLLHQPVFLITRPELIEHVLVAHPERYVKGTRGYRLMRFVVGNGLLTSDGDFWLRQRRIAQPAFHRKRIEAFGEVMTTLTRAMLERWRSLPEMRHGFDVSREMMRLTLQIVGATLLSRDVTADAGDVGEALTTSLAQIIYRLYTPWALPQVVPTSRNRRARAAIATLDRVVGAIIEDRRRSTDRHDDLLDMLLHARDPETGEGMTDAQLRDEVMTLFLAGHETTAMALTWTLHLLGQHPDVEQKLRDELRPFGEEPLTASDSARLDLTGRVVQEAIRLYPPVWIFGRSAIAEDVLGGCRVRPGDWVLISPWATHRAPDLWPDPERFDPDRFLPEQSHGRHRFAYLPFSGGGRKCIGDQFAMLEAKLVLGTLMQQVRLALDPGHPVEPQPLLTLRPRKGVMMRLVE